MIEISVRQEDGHIGFSYSRKGIADDNIVYEGAVGPIPLLRKALMNICDELECARNRRIKELEKAIDSPLFSPHLRAELREVLQRNIEAKESDEKLAKRLKEKD